MQTHCPHCDTHFRVTQSQIDAAEGHVCCGVCEEIFNVYDIADEESLKENHQPLLSNIDEPLTDQEAYQAEATDSPDEEETENFHDEYLPDTDDNNDEDEVYDDDQENHDDFFDKDNDETVEHIVPDDIRLSQESAPPSMTSTILWSIGILIFTATLILQYIWFNQDDFRQFPQLQAGLENICKQLGCKQQARRDAAKIKLLSRNVYSHPNEKDVLMINVVMKNQADFAQPYPIMQIEFSDIRGGIVVARRFLPHEYLATRYLNSETKQPHMLQPDADASITLEIKDPGKQAMTYEFNFL